MTKIENNDYIKYFDENGKYHREDGPAFISKINNSVFSSFKHWYIHGKIHRLDGPAVEYSNGISYWYLEGRFLSKIKSQEEFERYFKLIIFL